MFSLLLPKSFQRRSTCLPLLVVAVCYRKQCWKGDKASNCSTRRLLSTDFENFTLVFIAPLHFKRSIRLSWRSCLGLCKPLAGVDSKWRGWTRTGPYRWLPRMIRKLKAYKRSLSWLCRNRGLWSTWQTSVKPKTKVFWLLSFESGVVLGR